MTAPAHTPTAKLMFLNVLLGVTNRHPDWDLVEAAQRGDRAAFGELYTRCRPAIHRFALGATGDPWLADDLTSETFTRAWRAIGSLTYHGSDVVAWLRTITRNLIRDHRKSARYRHEHLVDETLDWAELDTRTPERIVIDREVARELAEVLGRSLAGLTPDQRRCVRLRFVDELPQADIARVMGRTELAVRAVQHRAITKLREQLGEGGEAT